jgi:hypothetical protein
LAAVVGAAAVVALAETALRVEAALGVEGVFSAEAVPCLEAVLCAGAAFFAAAVFRAVAGLLEGGVVFFAGAVVFWAGFSAVDGSDTFVAFAVLFAPVWPCSPTAESRRTTTRPAPLACALTGDLDTRPA